MSPILRAIRSWWLVALLSAGCTSYQETSLHQIESHPDKFIDKKVRVHYDAAGDSINLAGRTALERQVSRFPVPDSVVGLQIEAVRFPVLEGWTFADPRLYDTNPEDPLQVDLTGARKVEVYGTDPVRTFLAIAGVALVAAAIYAAVRAGSESAWDDWLHGISHERLSAPPVGASPR